MKKTAILTAILMIALATTMVITAQAAVLTENTSPFISYPTELPTFLQAWGAPDPIGVNQVMYLNAIFSKPIPTSHGMLGDMYEGITIQVKDPDGQVTTLGPHDGGMIGGWSTTFTPTKVGTYTVQAFYPGQILKGTNPYNSDPTTQDYHPELDGSKQLPTNSTPTTFVCQADPVTAPYQTPPLPTQYWSRPVMALNWAWGNSVASNWLGLDATGFCTSGKYDASGCVQPYGTAPNTAHILWSRSTKSGGQPGGPIPADPTTQFTSTSVVINMYDGMICLNGIGYYTNHISWTGQVTGWTAVDLRTGKVIWEKPAGITGTETLKEGFLFDFSNAQEYGSIAYLITTPDSQGVTRLYDAYSGTLQANLTSSRSLALICDDANVGANRQSTSGDLGHKEQIGALLGWFVQGGALKRWNSTYLFTARGTANLQARTKVNAANYNWTDGIDQVIPLPTENGLNNTLSVRAVTPDVILLRYCPTYYYQGTDFGWQVTVGYDAVTGQKLWGPLNQTLPLLEDASAIEAAREGHYIVLNKDKMQISSYSLNTGQLEWGPVQCLYNGNSWLDVYLEVAYDKVFMWDTGGIVQAYNANTGDRVWNWSRGSSGFDDPRGIYELFGYRTHSIADGKLFLQEGFMYTPPLHPARLLALNTTDGTLVWDILQYGARSGAPIADGILTNWDSYDCKIYAFGKGPSETTVSAPDMEVPAGSAVTIKGTVMDISAGTQQEGVIENFPRGVPAVSDASMTHWMEYVYKQQVKPSNATGVTVKLSVLDANNNLRDIGTTTSDANGYFTFSWMPDIPGAYTVYANFGGSESYWGSSAVNSFTVAQSPSGTSAPTQPPASLADQYFLPATAGMIVAIILVGAVLALLVLRKH